MLTRIPEPELMDTTAQAEAYAAADFSEPNEAFIGRLERACGTANLLGRLLDLGCGPADIAIRLARRHPDLKIDALDGSASMLATARRALAGQPEQLARRVRLIQAYLPVRNPASVLGEERYDLITSNSLLHHLHRPEGLWQTISQLARPGCPVVVMDLARPDSRAAAQSIVDRYAAAEPEILREDFYNSLLAAFTPDEVEAQLRVAGLGHFRVSMVSDRHLLVVGRMDVS